MFKNICFHFAGVLLHYLYLVLMITYVFLVYNKVYITCIYMCCKMSYFKHVLASEYPFHINSISRNCSKFHQVQGSSFFYTCPRKIKPLRNFGHRSTIYDPTKMMTMSKKDDRPWHQKSMFFITKEQVYLQTYDPQEKP